MDTPVWLISGVWQWNSPTLTLKTPKANREIEKKNVL